MIYRNKSTRGFALDGNMFWYVDGESRLLTQVNISNGIVEEQEYTGSKTYAAYADGFVYNKKIIFIPRYEPEILIYNKEAHEKTILKIEWNSSYILLTKFYKILDDHLYLFPYYYQETIVKINLITFEIKYIKIKPEILYMVKNIHTNILFLGGDISGKKAYLVINKSNKICSFDLIDNSSMLKDLILSDEELVNICENNGFLYIVVSSKNYLYKCRVNYIGEIEKYEKISLKGYNNTRWGYHDIIDFDSEILLLQWNSDKSLLINKKSYEVTSIELKLCNSDVYTGITYAKKYMKNKVLILPGEQNEYYGIMDLSSREIIWRCIKRDYPWECFFEGIPIGETNGYGIRDYIGLIDQKVCFDKRISNGR